MKRIWKSLVMGMLVAVAGRSAQAGGGVSGGYSDRPLYPGGSPSAPLGNDLLLAENVPGAFTTFQGYAIPAETWTTTLICGEGDASHGITGLSTTLPSQKVPARIFDGSGQTGTYAGGTAGAGKHTENTAADIRKVFVDSSGKVYRYVFHVTAYDTTTGAVLPNQPTDINCSYNVCP